MRIPTIVVMSDFHTVGTTACGVEFIPIPSPPDSDVLKKDEREIEEMMAVRAASRLIVRLGNCDFVLLQHLAGNAMCGGPIDANDVLRQISFADVGMETEETEGKVRQRLIVFATSPEEAEGEMPVIRLQEIRVEELRMSELEIWGLGPEHPLAQILDLAKEADSRN